MKKYKQSKSIVMKQKIFSLMCMIMLVVSAQAQTTVTKNPKITAFTTPDLALCELKGHVKSDGSNNFTREGRLVVDEFFGYSVDRDENGVIVNMSNERYFFEYNPAKTVLSKIIRSDGSETTFLYNENGICVSRVEDQYDVNGKKIKKSKKYSYTQIKLDSKGNWISRVLDGNKETRTITYWDEN